MVSGHDDSDHLSVDGDGLVRRRYDWDRTPPSTAVVETVAEAAGVDATALVPLYDTLDPDSLDSLVVSGEREDHGADASVSFAFAGHLVNVHGTGEVVVREARATRRED